MTELHLATAVLPRSPEAAGQPAAAGQPEAAGAPGGAGPRPVRLLLLGALVGATLAGGAALGLADGGGRSLPTVVLTARHYRFTPARIAV